MRNSTALREAHPYRWLLLAILSSVVLAQIVWMVSLMHSQVEKAALHYAAEGQGATARKPSTSPTASAPSAAPSGRVNVSYVSAR